jgi:Acyl-CoA dehydrogenase, N-terminal domain
MFMLSDQQRAISDTATRFGAEHLAPFALQREQDRHFPVQVVRRSYGLCELGECGGHAKRWGHFGGEFVVAAAEVLDKGVTGGD